MTKYTKDYRKLVIHIGDGVTDSRALSIAADVVEQGRCEKRRHRASYEGMSVWKSDSKRYRCRCEIGKRGEDQFFVTLIEEKGEEK